MILAAAACAESGQAPPPELSLMWECQDFAALPYPGGLLDQPAGLIRRMRKAYAVWWAYREWGRAMRRADVSLARWTADHPEAWALKHAVDELRKQRERQQAADRH